MKGTVPLVKAHETALFGSKAVGLGQAIRDGLPVPPGVALSGAIVEAVAAGNDRAIKQVAKTARPLGGPLAVRSSARRLSGSAKLRGPGSRSRPVSHCPARSSRP